MTYLQILLSDTVLIKNCIALACLVVLFMLLAFLVKCIRSDDTGIDTEETVALVAGIAGLVYLIQDML